MSKQHYLYLNSFNRRNMMTRLRAWKSHEIIRPHSILNFPIACSIAPSTELITALTSYLIRFSKLYYESVKQMHPYHGRSLRPNDRERKWHIALLANVITLDLFIAKTEGESGNFVESISSQNIEDILPVATLMWPNWRFFLKQRCKFSEAEVYLLMFIKLKTKLSPLVLRHWLT